MDKRGRRIPKDAPLDRFTWKDGDVEIVYDPAKDPNSKSDEEKMRERGLTGRGHVPPGYKPPELPETVWFRARKRDK